MGEVRSGTPSTMIAGFRVQGGGEKYGAGSLRVGETVSRRSPKRLQLVDVACNISPLAF